MKEIITFLIIIFSCINCHSVRSRFIGKTDSSADKDTIVPTEIIENKKEISISIMESQIDLRYDLVIEANITNNTDDEIVTDLKYTIEYFNSDNWVECVFPDIIIFNDVALNIYPFSSASVDIYLYPEHLHYKPGLYRIKKMILVENIKKHYYALFNIAD